MRMQIATPVVPEGMPLLKRGRHRNPHNGACLMEYVSVLAGQRRRTDKPSCTHPALAFLARRVNDLIVDDEVRSRLALLAPRLVGTDIADPRLAPLITLVCLKAAVTRGARGADLDHRIWRARIALRRAETPARGKQSVRLGHRMNDELEIYGAVRAGWVHLQHHDDLERDQWLAQLLVDAVDRAARLLPENTISATLPTGRALIEADHAPTAHTR